MIEHCNVTKRYGAVEAVSGLSFSAPDGQIVGLLGQNGAGKTTTLKSVAGILNYDSGTIMINGKDVKTEPIECKKITAYIPDNPDLYDYMTGIKYLNFIADIFGVGPRSTYRGIFARHETEAGDNSGVAAFSEADNHGRTVCRT